MSDSLPVRPATILIVDDDVETRDMFRLMLSGLDVRILEAGMGLDAMAIAEAEQPNVILLDLMLPDLSGLEVCARLRELPACRICKIVMVTAMHNRRAASTAAGADDFWSKPIDTQTFRSGVLSLLKSGSHVPLPVHA
jgi:two-component system cell cycle response regulator